jgi:Protein of unknown function (DUF2723)
MNRSSASLRTLVHALGVSGFIAGAGLIVYCLSAAPTVLWGDDAELQRIAITGEARAIGQSSAASHLLWQAVAMGFVRSTTWLPVDAAGRVTLVSSIAGALALVPIGAAAGLIAVRAGFSGRAGDVAGVVAALAFGLSHTFWLLASRPDAYTIQTLLLATSLWVMLRAGLSARPILWWVAGIATVSLAMMNHVMILASVPGLAVLGVAGVRVRARTMMWGGIIGGAALLMIGIFASMAGFPVGALVRAIVSYRPYLPSFRDIALVPVYLVYQFPVALLLVFWAGRPLVRCGIATVLGIALTYSGVVGLMLFRFHPEMYVRDQFLFYLPSYVPVAIMIGLGAGELSQRPAVMARLTGWRGPVLLGSILLAPLAVYPVATLVAGGVATRLAPSRVLPGRDPVSYYLWPPKTGYNGAREYADAAFGALPVGAVVIADWLPYQVLRYAQVVERARSDLRLEMINAGDDRQVRFLREQPEGTPLYLADASPLPYYEMDGIRACHEVVKTGVVYRLDRHPGVGCAGG